ncbi:hypothetical protein BC629DRAFT_1206658 [Irpex lacteus]|nr:hypothetical protein BC629DRAFT_1206658 [Irpex lacteus]
MATLNSKLTKDPVPGTATGVETHAAALPGYKHPLDPLTPEEASSLFPCNTALYLLLSYHANLSRITLSSVCHTI